MRIAACLSGHSRNYWYNYPNFPFDVEYFISSCMESGLPGPKNDRFYVSYNALNNVETDEANIDDIIKTVSNVALPLTQFQLYLGTDIYGNNIYHNIQYITNEIIDLTSEFTTIYNDFLKRLNELRNELQKTRSTIIKQPITMVNLVRLLYFGEYNPQNIDEERELINKLCFLNNIDNFHFISGKIFY